MPSARQRRDESANFFRTLPETVKAYAAGLPRLAGKIAGDPGPQWAYHGLQKLIRNPATRRRFGKWEATRKPRSAVSIDNDGWLSVSRQLEHKGLTSDLHLLTPGQAQEMHDYLCSQRWHDEWHLEQGGFAFTEIPEECGIASVPLDSLVRTPHLFSLASNTRVLAVLEKCLGCKPRLEEIYVSWASPQENQLFSCQQYGPCLFHRDTDGMQIIKLFLCLTDMNAQSGPHVYVLGSHRRNLLTKPGTFTDEEVISAFGCEHVASVTGAKGMCFLENSFGIHKASKPRSTGRMLVQLMYSSHPTICLPKRPVIVAKDIVDEEFSDYDPYVLGKFIEQ